MKNKVVSGVLSIVVLAAVAVFVVLPNASAATVRVGSFIITTTDGSQLTYGTDYSYNNIINDEHILTIKTDKHLTIGMESGETTDSIVVDAGSGKIANITLDGININIPYRRSPIEILGTATITLAAGSTNNLAADDGEAALNVPNGADLTIDGNGKLIATCFMSGAGIGNDGYITSASGNITINGGTIIATSNHAGAGIGGGKFNSSGAITISGTADVTASSKGEYSESGAGIGGGSDATSGPITITGGKVKATAALDAAGIGSGRNRSNSKIIITGGTVEASSSEGAGIGSGAFGGGDGTIDISGGNITAISTNGAGIGGGLGGTGGNITISGGTINATSTSGAGIGGIGGGLGGIGANLTIGDVSGATKPDIIATGATNGIQHTSLNVVNQAKVVIIDSSGTEALNEKATSIFSTIKVFAGDDEINMLEISDPTAEDYHQKQYVKLEGGAATPQQPLQQQQQQQQKPATNIIYSNSRTDTTRGVYTFSSTGPFSEFSGIWIHGAAIPSSYYTAARNADGTVSITLADWYVRTLNYGEEYLLHFVFNSGYGVMKFYR